MITKHNESAHFVLENATLEQVEEYNYLGQVSAYPKHVTEIRRRRGRGGGALGKRSQIMRSKLPLSLKRRLYNQYILPVKTYRAENWRLTTQL